MKQLIKVLTALEAAKDECINSVIFIEIEKLQRRVLKDGTIFGPALSPEEIGHLNNRDKIMAIKAYRERTGKSLTESKQFIEGQMLKLGYGYEQDDGNGFTTIHFFEVLPHEESQPGPNHSHPVLSEDVGRQGS